VARVLVRSVEHCDVACIEKVTRTVWDGDRILWEIRTGGDNPERDVVPAGQLPPYHVDAGRVAYTFGETLDHPRAAGNGRVLGGEPGAQQAGPDGQPVHAQQVLRRDGRPLHPGKPHRPRGWV
jgi:hypothetical protein